MKQTIFSRVRSVGFQVLLAVMATMSLTDCDRSIPILVTIHGLKNLQSTIEIVPTLDGKLQNKARIENPSAPFVVYAPADAHGRLQLDIDGRDGECLIKGSTQLEVDSKAPMLQATIEIDPKHYPQCQLKLIVDGPGSVSANTPDFMSCEGSMGKNDPCYYSFVMGTRLTLFGHEQNARSAQEGWKSPCIATPEGCALVMDKNLEVVTSFFSLICQPGGSCDWMPGKAAPARIISSDGNWAIGSKDKNLYTWNTSWAKVNEPESKSIYALWSAGNTAWALTDREIRVCNTGTTPPCHSLHQLRKSGALYGFGGDESPPRFWVAYPDTIYRCSDTVCIESAVSALQPVLPSGAVPTLINITADTAQDTIVSGSYLSDNQCYYFMQRCTGNRCDYSPPLLSLSPPCLSRNEFRFRAELGSDLGVWVYPPGLNRLARYQTAADQTKSGRYFPISASINDKSSGGSGLIWVIGAGGHAIQGTPANMDIVTTNTQYNLNAIWIDNKQQAWVIGDHGVLFTANTSKVISPIDTRSTASFDVIYGDNTGMVRVLSQQDGTHLRCTSVSCFSEIAVP